MRRRLSYANVVATLALFFAISGGALAAKHYLINSTNQINPKVLKKLKGNIGKTGAPGASGATGATGNLGTAGKNGANGERGPSTAFSTSASAAELSVGFPAKANEKLTVSSLTLPAGNFSVVGKLIANNNGVTIAEVQCELLLGGKAIDPAPDILRMTEEGKGADRTTIALTGVGSLASPGTANIVCRVSSTSGDYDNAAITAIQVGSVG